MRLGLSSGSSTTPATVRPRLATSTYSTPAPQPGHKLPGALRPEIFPAVERCSHPAGSCSPGRSPALLPSLLAYVGLYSSTRSISALYRGEPPPAVQVFVSHASHQLWAWPLSASRS